ncbi:glycosyltransferase [Mycobacterium parmense]|uniref:Glycosyl transferase family 1 n=1 Tax=Mycobacterium parmense TaxID=185642 RepID=A0A7I7YRX5_9MYCO|nr:glycosyltransferase [Mycobacterium parmense]MCV7352025.1 glycosyltransferase [Mycobacterium parmense]ORW56592.1 glycosyl transferase family 1 [Mycobacterium parmense]BBZ44500.1 glycosyl transferase family 1 [Mycobacterium parmense]
MKFVLANWGRRGDVEPCVAIGRELSRRGHDVRMAVPPDLVGFAESVGLEAVACGPDTQAIMGLTRKYWTCYFSNPWKIRELRRLRNELAAALAQCFTEVSTTLASVTDEADLLCIGVNFEVAAANVAEYHRIPLASLHWFPVRGRSQVLSFLPAPLSRGAMSVFWWLSWLVTKKVEDAQRHELGLPKATGPAQQRITERGSLEIQAYEEVCFPGLAAEWKKWGSQRPFVGTLTMELTTDADEEVASWIAAGTPPICFVFGSIALESAADTLAMIGATCAQLGERALVCAAGTDFSGVPSVEHVKVVGAVNYAAVFPACRAVVHHGGGGTTAAVLRAGVPALILWTLPDQPLWGAAIKRLGVGTARRLSATSQKSLVADLGTILAPEYLVRARELATRMTKPAESVATAADLVERFARAGRVG